MLEIIFHQSLQLLADTLVSSLVQLQSLVCPVSNSVMAPPSLVPSSNFLYLSSSRPLANTSVGSLLQSQSPINNNVIAPASPVPPNTNPFYVRFIEGNIRVCQGCKTSLKCANGSLPAPPFDLCCARAEKRTF